MSNPQAEEAAEPEEAQESPELQLPDRAAEKQEPPTPGFPEAGEDGSPPLLTDWFQQVYVINCAHRPDRRQEVIEELEPLADMEKVTIYPAVIGDYTGHPAGFGGGRGAWGCLQSHRRIMEDLMHTRDERGDISWDAALILEDDVFFLERALEKLDAFMQEVPPDWGQIYLGGQHRKRVTPTKSPLVVVGNSVNRTHAYALSRERIKEVYHHVSYMMDYNGNNYHIDHQLERAHNRKDWPVYCPTKWICGQRAGSSNVSGKQDGDRTWQ